MAHELLEDNQETKIPDAKPGTPRVSVARCQAGVVTTQFNGYGGSQDRQGRAKPLCVPALYPVGPAKIESFEFGTQQPE